ncbi:hypothetical protein B4U79_16355 [Dinothrombium tinctorium]|uniref:Uncharacterized protein n=1 Tax=Dinothrombium tinctorium TaxID=1965070 RepID=A0A3S3NRG9_9ACAR|nr:hypothetical protein B4U79_16400 [Dinothrombium tinctorium]RWS04636.1 hypothetical protein B4U79_16393 [Dinothrombium tinctorium]RWS05028.1 hypothetical protein B4U79_16355 [Dinothrombium tinctorium]
MSFDLLPDEIILNVISSLESSKEFAAFSATSKRLNILCDQHLQSRKSFVAVGSDVKHLNSLHEWSKDQIDKKKEIGYQMNAQKLLFVLEKKMPNIETLCIIGVKGLNMKNYFLIGQYALNLKHLAIADMIITERQWCKLFSSCQRLETLDLWWYTFSTTKFWLKLPKLKRLAIKLGKQDYDKLYGIHARLKNSLESLAIICFPIETKLFIPNLKLRYPNLRELHTNMISTFMAYFILAIAKQGKIEKLRLHVLFSPFSFDYVDCSQTNVLSVKSLDLMVYAPDECHGLLVKFPNVEKLHITLSSKRNERPIAGILSLRNLKELSLFIEPCRKNIDAIEILFDIPQLHRISVKNLKKSHFRRVAEVLNEKFRLNPEWNLKIKLYTIYAHFREVDVNEKIQVNYMEPQRILTLR